VTTESSDEGSQPKESDKKLIEDEFKNQGSVSIRVYWIYIKAAGLFAWGIVVAALIVEQVISE
jgi:hypothetical protein